MADRKDLDRVKDAVLRIAPPGAGFVVFLFEFGELPLPVQCVTNARPEAVKAILREYIAKLSD